MTTLLDKLDALITETEECIDYNNQPHIELPHLVDDKFSFEQIRSWLRALKKAVEIIQDCVSVLEEKNCTASAFVFKEAIAEIEKELG